MKYQESPSSGNRSDTIWETDIRGDSAELIVAYLSRRQLKHLQKLCILYSVVYIICEFQFNTLKPPCWL